MPLKSLLPLAEVAIINTAGDLTRRMKTFILHFAIRFCLSFQGGWRRLRKECFAQRYEWLQMFGSQFFSTAVLVYVLFYGKSIMYMRMFFKRICWKWIISTYLLYTRYVNHVFNEWFVTFMIFFLEKEPNNPRANTFEEKAWCYITL